MEICLIIPLKALWKHLPFPHWKICFFTQVAKKEVENFKKAPNNALFGCECCKQVSFLFLSCYKDITSRTKSSSISCPPSVVESKQSFRAVFDSSKRWEVETTVGVRCSAMRCPGPGINRQQETLILESIRLLSRWRPPRWCCCPAGVETTSWLWWKSRFGSRDSGFLLRRCRCPRMWWRRGGASSHRWWLLPGGTACSCSALYSVCRKENTAASLLPY